MNDFPFRGVYHNRNAGNIGFGCQKIQEAHHSSFAVDHAFVHIDVQNLRTAIDLFAGNGQSSLEVAVFDHAQKGT